MRAESKVLKEKVTQLNEDIPRHTEEDQNGGMMDNLFKAIIDLERSLQMKKQSLTYRSDFNLVDAFKIVATIRKHDRSQDMIDKQ